jgi:hypothetical protein
VNLMKRFSPFLVASFAVICIFILSGAAAAQEIKILDPSYTPVTLVKDTPLPGVNGATIGKPGALGSDGAGNLLVLDGASQRLFRIRIRDLAISILAMNLPVSYGLAGSYPTVEFPLSMTVTERADIYLTTMNRGVIKLEKAK